MATAEFDTSDMREFIISLERIPIRLNKVVRDVVKDAAKDLRDEWRDNARAIDLPHGKRYPGTITTEEEDFGFAQVIGPVSARPQGGMGRGFEYGSINQRPHLEGNRAADTVFPRFERRVGIAAEDVFRGL